MAIKAFERSQSLQKKWGTAERDAKRHILDIISLNFTLDGATLTPHNEKAL